MQQSRRARERIIIRLSLVPGQSREAAGAVLYQVSIGVHNHHHNDSIQELVQYTLPLWYRLFSQIERKQCIERWMFISSLSFKIPIDPYAFKVFMLCHTHPINTAKTCVVYLGTEAPTQTIRHRVPPFVYPSMVMTATCISYHFVLWRRIKYTIMQSKEKVLYSN